MISEHGSKERDIERQMERQRRDGGLVEMLKAFREDRLEDHLSESSRKPRKKRSQSLTFTPSASAAVNHPVAIGKSPHSQTRKVKSQTPSARSTRSVATWNKSPTSLKNPAAKTVKKPASLPKQTKPFAARASKSKTQTAIPENSPSSGGAKVNDSVPKWKQGAVNKPKPLRSSSVDANKRKGVSPYGSTTKKTPISAKKSQSFVKKTSPSKRTSQFAAQKPKSSIATGAARPKSFGSPLNRTVKSNSFRGETTAKKSLKADDSWQKKSNDKNNSKVPGKVQISTKTPKNSASTKTKTTVPKTSVASPFGRSINARKTSALQTKSSITSPKKQTAQHPAASSNCPSCGTPRLRMESKFCKECGFKLQTISASPSKTRSSTSQQKSGTSSMMNRIAKFNN